MPLDRTAYNALVDEAPGVSGTTWNKAQIASVILDPVDAAVVFTNSPSSLQSNVYGTAPLTLNAKGDGQNTYGGGALLTLIDPSGAADARRWDIYAYNDGDLYLQPDPDSGIDESASYSYAFGRNGVFGCTQVSAQLINGSNVWGSNYVIAPHVRLDNQQPNAKWMIYVGGVGQQCEFRAMSDDFATIVSRPLQVYRNGNVTITGTLTVPMITSGTVDLIFQTGSTERLRLTQDGQVVIGKDVFVSFTQQNGTFQSVFQYREDTPGVRLRTYVSLDVIGEVVSSGNIYAGGGGYIGWGNDANSTAAMYSQAPGDITMQNPKTAYFNRLTFGHYTGGDRPAFKVAGPGLEARLADDTKLTSFRALLVNQTKAGTPTDADTVNPQDGMMILDTSGSRLWVRVGGVWKSELLA